MYPNSYLTSLSDTFSFLVYAIDEFTHVLYHRNIK